MIKLVADLHLHTISSGHAFSTVQEYVASAKKKGLEAIGITDHGPGMPGGAHLYHFQNLRIIPGKIDGLRILKGAECNVVDRDGNIDLPESTLRNLDIVMAAFHPRCGYEGGSEEQNTEVLLKAMENPAVNILAHPGNPGFPVNAKKIVEAAKEREILIEINNGSFTGWSRVGSRDKCLQFAKEIKSLGSKLIIGSDAHISMDVGRFDEALKLIQEAGLSEENIVNTSIEKIEKYLLGRRRG